MFSDVKHKIVFDFFTEISQIPRGSGNERAIADYLVNFAKSRDLYCVRDEVNNVFIRKPASCSEMGDSLPVLLQGHTDMVCEALPEVKHDFLKDPIKFVREGDRLFADGTTLGADNGVAVAIMLAILDSDDIVHPTLECLFTVGEEVGMDGMHAFDTSLLCARRMINLDSAGEGIATVACAGGVRTDFSYSPEASPLSSEDKVYSIKVSGLYGGHSGEDINLGRYNAIECTARIIRNIGSVTTYRIISVKGGDKDNAIPRHCETVLALDKNCDVLSIVKRCEAEIKRELISDDANFSVECTECEYSGNAVSSIDSVKLVDCISLMRSGPVKMSPIVEGMVETSYNLAVIRVNVDYFKLTVSSRSSVESSLDDMERLMASFGRLAGFKEDTRGRYPGWQYAEISPLRDTYLNIYKDLFGKDGMAIGIHAGLECGLLVKKVPDMDIISIGPDIKDLHSPSESMSIASLDRLFDIVLSILKVK